MLGTMSVTEGNVDLEVAADMVGRALHFDRSRRRLLAGDAAGWPSVRLGEVGSEGGAVGDVVVGDDVHAFGAVKPGLAVSATQHAVGGDVQNLDFALA